MRRVLLMTLWTLATGCASGFRQHVQLPPDGRASAIAVYPFGFRWPEPAYRSFELSQRVIDANLARHGERALFFGPSEFRVLRAEDDNAFAASTLASLLAPSHLQPSDVLVMRPWAEKRVQTSQRTLHDAKGRTVGQGTSEDVTWVGHVEVLHPATLTRWVEVSGEVVADPFAERSDEGADPAPELTELMQRLTRAALEAIEDRLGAPQAPARREGFRFALSPRTALAWADSGRSPGEIALARLDALDAELFHRARARFANPGAEPAVLDQLVRLPAGLHVLQAPAGTGLEPGDLIVQVNGLEALPHTFARARLLPGEDVLRVRRHRGDYEDLRLP